jgi:hypothetical protein
MVSYFHPPISLADFPLLIYLRLWLICLAFPIYFLLSTL